MKAFGLVARERTRAAGTALKRHPRDWQVQIPGLGRGRRARKTESGVMVGACRPRPSKGLVKNKLP